MTTINGLPAHVLLVHFIVVLVPLTAFLAFLCALWPTARQRLIWLTVAFALFTAIATPLTASAGEWLEHRVGRSAVLHTHTELGDTMTYFSAALLIAVGLLALIHYRQARIGATSRLARGFVVTFVVLASIAASVQVYRIGDSGAQATWGDQAGVAADDSSG